MQTNALPNHCYKAIVNNPEPQVIDFEVLFNPDVSGVKNTEITTQVDMDLRQCTQEMGKDTTIPAENEFTLKDGNPDNRIVGVSLSGVPFFGGTSEHGYDAFFPKKYGSRDDPEKIDVDMCLGSSEFTRTYHYYSFSPCILDTTAGTRVETCADTKDCKKDMFKYSLSYLTND